MDGKSLVSQMQTLVSALRAVVQQPNAPNQQNLAAYRNSLYQAVSDSQVDKFSPAWKQILEEIGGEEFFGATLKQKIETILANNQMTPTVAADELEQIRQRMEKFQNAINQGTSAFNTLRINDERLEPRECEIGMLTPRGEVDNRLDDFCERVEGAQLHSQPFIGRGNLKP